jgi:putative addiction module antidote
VDRDLSNSGRRTIALDVQQIGETIGVVLPNDLLARLKLRAGDKLYLIEQSDGSLRLSSFDVDTAQTMEIAERIMDEYPDTFVALAK